MLISESLGLLRSSPHAPSALSHPSGLWLLVISLIFSCDPKPKDRSQSIEKGPPPAPHPKVAIQRRTPAPILSLSEPAYQARLAFDGADLVLITPHGLHRVAPSGALRSTPLELGLHAHLLRRTLVDWSENAFWTRPVSGGEKKLLVKTIGEPSLSEGKGDDLAWVERQAGESFLRTTSARGARTVHRTKGTIVSLLLHARHAFFSETERSGSWRIGRAALESGSVEFTGPHSSRPPSMLAASEDALYYYEGLEGGVHELLFDFSADRVLRTQMICSPLAAADMVYCASVPGLSSLSRDGRESEFLSLSRDGPIARVATNGATLAWVTDLGPDQMAVRQITLTQRSLSNVHPEDDRNSPDAKE